MIKFFRKIRQQLLTESRFGKYLIYAIGEIVLVVIGILIALQVNNWNENRKNSLKEIQILENLKKDLLANKLELHRVTNKTNRTALALDSILKYQNGEILNLGNEIFVRLVMTGGNYVTYKTQEGSIQDVLSSGVLNIIKNDSIRFAIGSWKDNLKEIREWEETSINSKKNYNDYLNHHINIYNFDNQITPINTNIKKELLNDRLYLNNVSNRIFYSKRLNNLYKKEFPKLENLITKIDKYLEQ